MKAFFCWAGAVFLSLGSYGQIAPTEAALRTAVATGGTITFTGDGTIALNTPLAVNSDVTIDATGQNIVIDGQTVTRLFEVNAGKLLTLKNMILANGRSKGVDAASSSETGGNAQGGALTINGGEVTAIDCVFTNNSAIGGQGYFPLISGPSPTQGGFAIGGAIWQSGGSLTVQGGSFVANEARAGNGTGPQPGRGGAIFANGGIVTVDGTSFATNNALGGAGIADGFHPVPVGGVATGGAIFAESASVTVRNSTFKKNNASAGSNSSGFGGAISVETGELTAQDSHFLLNDVVGGRGGSWRNQLAVNGLPGNGGAIYVGNATTAFISKSTFAENNSRGGKEGSGLGLPAPGSGFGAAIYVDGTGGIVNSTFVSNSAIDGGTPDFAGKAPDSDGGAIFNKGTLGATNITVLSNSATAAILSSAAGTFRLKNSLLGMNTSSLTSAGVTDAGHNLSALSTAGFTEPSSQVNPSLKLGPLGDWGGPTPTIILLAGSPAINAADDAAAPTMDQRGRTRPFGAHSDIGAFESSPPFHIFGKLIGDLTDTFTVTHDALVLIPEATGEFDFVVPAGNNSFSFTAGNSVVRPNPLVIDVTADMETHAAVFKFQALASDPDAETPTFVFAGKSGETWKFEISSDLKTWTEHATHTFSADGIFAMPLTGLSLPVFMKGTKQ